MPSSDKIIGELKRELPALEKDLDGWIRKCQSFTKMIKAKNFDPRDMLKTANRDVKELHKLETHVRHLEARLDTALKGLSRDERLKESGNLKAYMKRIEKQVGKLKTEVKTFHSTAQRALTDRRWSSQADSIVEALNDVLDIVVTLLKKKI